MGQARSYDDEFKVQAVKMAKNVGAKRASEEVGMTSLKFLDMLSQGKDDNENTQNLCRQNL